MVRNSLRLFLALIAFIGLLQTGCGKFFTNSKGGGGGGGNSTTTFVYAASSSGVFAFKADLTNGTLTTLSGSPFGTNIPAPATMVIDPNNRFLYVGSSAGISGFSINSDGTLNSIALNLTAQPTPVALAASASTLYILDTFNTLTPLNINSNGSLSTPSGSTAIQVTGTASGLVIDPAGQHLYVALGTTGILTVTINSDGTLTPNTGNIVSPSGTAISFTHLAITPNGKSLYATANGGVVAFVFTTNGIPQALNSGSVITTGTNPSGAAVDANSSFLYVTNQASDKVSSFSITNSGLITQITGSPFDTGSGPTGVAVSSNSNFVFVSNSQGVQMFAVDTSTPGKLNAKATVNAGNNPAAIATLH